jgi:hypothetical protein
MRDSFVHTIKKLLHGENNVQAPSDHNGPLQSNWVGLLDNTHQPITSQPLVELSTQLMMLEKTLEQILKDISTQVLETKYVLNLGPLLKIVPNIKRHIFKLVKST